MGVRMTITDEIWWRREIVPPTLVALGDRLCAHFGIPPANIGEKGNADHRRGYHRSLEWLLNSAYATNRSYSVDETPGNRRGDPRWIAAMDVTLPAAQLIAACQRLDTAVRAGRLEKIAEWYGNDDGDNRVDGYDNIRNVVATSDDSHLWHLHISFVRDHAADDHSDVLAVLTGGDDMFTDDDRATLRNVQGRVGEVYPIKSAVLAILEAVGRIDEMDDEIRAKLDATRTELLAEVDQVEELLAAIQAGDPEQLAQRLAALLGDQITDELLAALTRIRINVADPEPGATS